MIYFTADMHLGHQSIITLQDRPFEDIDEMDKVIITNYNAVVNKDDTVYILGDICHRVKADVANAMIRQIKGKKYLIKGNHDKEYDPSLFIDIQDIMEVSLNGEKFVLMHYPMLSWNKMHGGSYHIHGHIHARMDYNEGNKSEGIRRYDVGVDANNFYPISVKQILEFFNS